MTPRHIPPTLPSIIKERMCTDAQLALGDLDFCALAGCPITYSQSIACMFYASLADSVDAKHHGDTYLDATWGHRRPCL
jgi:hypothetical protein